MALTLTIPRDIDLAAIPLPEMENVVFRFRTFCMKRYVSRFSSSMQYLGFLICSASGSPTAATSSLPTRVLGCILLYAKSKVNNIDWTLRCPAIHPRLWVHRHRVSEGEASPSELSEEFRENIVKDEFARLLGTGCG